MYLQNCIFKYFYILPHISKEIYLNFREVLFAFAQRTTFGLSSAFASLALAKASGQALDRLVTVSSTYYYASTSALSTSSSSRGLTS